MKELTVPGRLVLAFNPGIDPLWERSQFIQLRGLAFDQIGSLTGTGVTLLLNSTLRALGYGAIRDFRARGLQVFADLALSGDRNLMEAEGKLLAVAKPDIVTVSPLVSQAALSALRAELHGVDLLVDTTNDFTSINEELRVLGGNYGVLAFAQAKRAANAGLDGVFCEPSSVYAIRHELGQLLSVAARNVCPTWAREYFSCRHDAATVTPAEALQSGASHIVIELSALPPDPQSFVRRILDEIAAVV
jgi:orotidine-5'-phosphate decarboxylase